MNVEGDFAIFRTGRGQKIFRAEPQFQLLQNRSTLGNRFNQKISGARKRVVNRRRPERNADVDNSTDVEAERFEVFEKKTEISNRCIRTQQPKPQYLQRMIDASENG